MVQLTPNHGQATMTQHLDDYGRRSGLSEVPAEADLATRLPSPPPATFDYAPHYFLTFHDGRQGWHVRDDGIPESQRLPGDFTRQTFEQFTQRWLYFELIRAVIRRDPAEFVTVDDGGRRWINSATLKERSEEWYNYETTHAPGRLTRLTQAQHVLDTARYFVSNFCAVSEPGRNPSWPIDRRILLSFMILGQTLSRVFVRILDENVDLKIQGWTSPEYNAQGWGYTNDLFDALLRDGWCKKTIFMLQGLMRKNTLGLLNALEIEKPHVHPGIHINCTITECKLEMERDHELYHCCDQSNRASCALVGRETEELNYIVACEKKIPLLRFTRGSRNVDLVRMERSCPEKYVVFSHIFSDGFGNPSANKLNSCVLDYFVDLFQVLGVPNIHFWIDTLTVPVLAKDGSNRGAIKEAIDSFQRIYSHAQHTIVLDRSLMKVNLRQNYVPPAMAVTVSQWMTRLWTLQEAVFSRSIQFAFKDKKLLSYQELEDKYFSTNRVLHDGRAEASRAYYHGTLGNERQDIVRQEFATRNELIKRPEFVGQVWKASQWRTVKYEQHEMLALALLFQVQDMTQFADTSNTTKSSGFEPWKVEELMQCILIDLDRHSAIPAGIIFLPGRRLSARGFGWAPVSWLSMREVDVPDPFQLKAEPGRWSPDNGLVVQFPGIRLLEIHPRKGTNRPLGDGREFHFPINRYRQDWYVAKVAATDDILPDAKILRGMELALILPRFQLEAPREIGLLVAVADTHNSTYHAWAQCRVWVQRETSEKRVREWRNEFDRAVAPALLCGQVLPATQRWCVDSQELPVQRTPVPSPLLPPQPPPSPPEPPKRQLFKPSTWRTSAKQQKSKKPAATGEPNRVATFQPRPGEGDVSRMPTV